MKFSNSDGTSVIPYWPSVPWWPLIITHEGSFRREVLNFAVIHPGENHFVPAVPGGSMFSNIMQNFYLLALRFVLH